MVSYSDLKDADPEKFSTAAAAYGDLADEVSERLERIHTQATDIGDAYDGQGGRAAVESINTQRDDLASSQGCLQSIQTALETLAEAVSNAQDDLEDAVERAADVPATVSSDGVVKVDWSSIDTTDMEGSDLSLLRQAKQAEADTVQEDIDDAVERATEADETAESEISGIEVVPPGEGSKPSLQPADDWTPQQINQWWEGLSSAERQWMLAHRADMVGATDGIPAPYRDIANRMELNSEIARLEGYDELNGDQEDSLEGMREIRERLDSTGAEGNSERAYLLLIDSAEDGKAIVSMGNPDTAENVFTYVPGIQTTLGDMGTHMGRVDQMVYDANQVEGGGSTAGIVWFGYDAPPLGGTEIEAENAAGDLYSFQEGLVASSQYGEETNHTMVGHSYGSTVVGVADRETLGLPVDQMVFVGSPGVGVDYAHDLSVGSDNVYASLTADDWANDVPAHGRLPTDEVGFESHQFGANVFESDTSGHSGYWDEVDGEAGSARDNMALIVTENGDQITQPEERRQPIITEQRDPPESVPYGADPYHHRWN